MKWKTNLPRWLAMALTDIVLVSFSTPLSVLAGIRYDRGDFTTFWMFTGIVMAINAVSLGLSWLVAWMILNKK